MKHTILPVFLVLGLLPSLASAQGVPAQELVHMRLVADTTAVQPGKPFKVGALFNIAPGWHIYWTNPGDSGQATVVEFNVPPGFTVGPLQYPLPVKFPQPGDLVGYGYQSQVLFTAEVTPPPDLKLGREAAISATTSFLVCQQVCIAGKHTDSRLLPVSDRPKRDNIDLFENWAAFVPVPAEESPAVESVEFDSTSVTVKWKTPPKGNVEFFPGTSDAVSIGNITVLNNANRTQVLFNAKVYDKSKLEPVNSVLAFNDTDDRRRAIRITHSVKEQTQGKK